MYEKLNTLPTRSAVRLPFWGRFNALMCGAGKVVQRKSGQDLLSAVLTVVQQLLTFAACVCFAPIMKKEDVAP